MRFTRRPFLNQVLNFPLVCTGITPSCHGDFRRRRRSPLTRSPCRKLSRFGLERFLENEDVLLRIGRLSRVCRIASRSSCPLCFLLRDPSLATCFFNTHPARTDSDSCHVTGQATTHSSFTSGRSVSPVELLLLDPPSGFETYSRAFL